MSDDVETWQESKYSTSSPRNSRNFYLQISLFAICKNKPKFGFRRYSGYLSLAYSWFDEIKLEIKFKTSSAMLESVKASD